MDKFNDSPYAYGCTLTATPPPWPCESYTRADGTTGYSNGQRNDIMPDPVAKLIITQNQLNVRALTLTFEVTDPQDPTQLLVDFKYTKYRHEDSAYEEE
ncbi:MAG: hypothetical protein IPL28_05380 [Chloroflexi bacterium]|nr:hypothetical protein [Chloroflexota bacterium]